MMEHYYPPRIGYVVKRYPRYSETFIVNEILAHEAAGLEVEIFALRPPNDSHFQDLISQVRAPVHYLPAKGIKISEFWETLSEAGELVPKLWATLNKARHEDPHDIYQAVLLAREAQARGIGHLHAHFATLATTVAHFAAEFAGIPYSFTAHAKDIFHEDVQAERINQYLKSAASVVTVSDYNVEYLRSHYGNAASGLQRIYNGLDLERFPYSAPRGDAPFIIAVGRLVEKKGFADLIDACSILAAQGLQFRCEIVGAGPLESELREQVARLGLQNAVELVGPLPQRDVVERVKEAAVFAAPCVIGEDGNRDGLPTVLLEAMALGTPCISTDVTGIPEVLRDGETGLMVPQHDPAALAKAMAELVWSEEQRARLAHNARQLIEAEFDVRKNSARLRELFIGTQHETAKLVGQVG